MAECKKIASVILLCACALIAAALLISCASMGSSEKEKKNLNSSVEAFNRSFRWEDYEAAAMFIEPDNKLQFWKLTDKFKGKIHITDYQIRDVDRPEKLPTATAVILFQYYRTAAPSLQTITFEQKWYFSEKDKIWRVGRIGFDAIVMKNDL